VFEVQIRSLLEHAWAEIEHGVVYKSGAQLPPDLRRRFASLAGVLELLEHDFGAVRSETDGLVAAVVAEVREALSARLPLDVPRMLAVLELKYPNGLSFREARRTGEAFPPGIEQRLCLALQRTGIRSTATLFRALSARDIRTPLRRYAEGEALTLKELSHLAVLAVLLGSRNPTLFRVFFPEFAADVSMRQALS